MMAKQKSNTSRFSQIIKIENNPKEMKRIKTNLDKLIATMENK